jgi:DNA-binding transcriptional MocR family regulator
MGKSRTNPGVLVTLDRGARIPLHRQVATSIRVTWLPPDLDEATVVRAAAGAGVGIEGVTPYRISHPGPGGLIFGYATVSEHAIAEGVGILAGVIDGISRPPAPDR